jgi:ParB-like chromosome segregation protein Spo0J
MNDTYEIMDGVRRAKAAYLAGHQVIRARLYDSGSSKAVREFEVPITALRSPHKKSVKRLSRGDQIRWQRVVTGAQSMPLPFPPIEIVEGSRGVKIEQITFVPRTKP